MANESGSERSDGGNAGRGSNGSVAPLLPPPVTQRQNLPDNPLLLEFFPPGNKMHDALFFRFGVGKDDVLPSNERVRLESLAAYE